MDDVCDTVGSYGTLTDGGVSKIIVAIGDATGSVTSGYSDVLGMTAGSTDHISDGTRQFLITSTGDTGTLSDGHEDAGDFDSLVGAQGRVSDGSKNFIFQTAGSTINGEDGTSDEVPAQVAGSSATVTDGALSASVVAMFGDLLTVSDGSEWLKFNMLGDTFDVTDGTADTVFQHDEVGETASLMDGTDSHADTASVLGSTATATDGAQDHLSAATSFGDELEAFDGALVDKGGAWSSPTQTFAMSRWEQAAFNSLAVIDGVLYGASDQGLFRFGVEHDEADDIDSLVKHGLTDFGDPSLKHASYYYAGYRSDGAIKVTVGYIPNGDEQSYTYALPARPALSPVPGRVKLGRGMRSRYWRFSLANVDGADFTISDQRMTVDNASRRV